MKNFCVLLISFLPFVYSNFCFSGYVDEYDQNNNIINCIKCNQTQYCPNGEAISECQNNISGDVKSKIKTLAKYSDQIYFGKINNTQS